MKTWRVQPPPEGEPYRFTSIEDAAFGICFERSRILNYIVSNKALIGENAAWLCESIEQGKHTDFPFKG